MPHSIVTGRNIPPKNLVMSWKKFFLPLALDYHLRSLTNEVDAVASAEVTNLNGDTSVFNAAVKV